MIARAAVARVRLAGGKGAGGITRAMPMLTRKGTRQ